MTTTFSAADEALVSSASRILRSKYRDYVEYEDVQQELYLWLWKNYHKAEGWREKYESRHAERTVRRALLNAGERYCRAEKAERCGYNPEDEAFYSIPMVVELLTLYFDPEWMVPSGIDYEMGGSPAPSENLVVMVTDVGRAYEALPAPDRMLLWEIYAGYGDMKDRIAGKAKAWECSYSAAYNRIRRVAGRVRAKLGGPNPYGADPE